jgi:very-short-patch-repair endonuclease
VDFCCPEHALVVELDGDIHAGRETEDRIRTRAIEERGYFVIRFTNEEVLRSLDAVLSEIHRAACRRVEASGD